MSSKRTFPNEPAGYRHAREELLQAEIDLRAQIERVAQMRRGLKPGGQTPQDYRFDELAADGSTRQVALSELFAPGKDSLLIYSYMFGPQNEQPCPACTSLIDGFNGIAPHVVQRTNFVIVAKSPIERIEKIARSRGWKNLRLLSSAHNSYNTDYLSEDEQGNQMPMLNVFVRGDDGIRHFWGSEMLYAKLDGHPRHVDLHWPLWSLLDLTPEGRGTDWFPQLSYD